MKPSRLRAQYTPKGEATTEPEAGANGEAWLAHGHKDPASAEYGAWLFQPDGSENAYYMTEDDLTFDEPTRITRAAYRKPRGLFAYSLAGVARIRRLRINDAVDGIKRELMKAATNLTQHLGTETTGGAVHRIGMPEALFMTLHSCGDHEAARLACESFLEQHQPDPFNAPAFGEYRGFMIEPNTATGDGWIVLDGERDMMPNGERFESVANARAAVDLLYENGMIITDDFLAECRTLTSEARTANS